MTTKEQLFRLLQKYQTCPARLTFICLHCGMVLSVIPMCSNPFVLLKCSNCGANHLYISVKDIVMLEIITALDPHEVNCPNLDNGICKRLGETKTRCVYIDKKEGC